MSPFFGMRALLVKPDTLTRRNLKEQLVAWGMRVSETESSTGALAEILAASSSGDPFALAIVDVARPVMNGIALARTIKSDPAMGGLRVVLLSARDQESEAVADLHGPGIAWLTKPVRQSALRACLAEIDGGAEPAAEPAKPRATAEGIAGARVLLVEDNPVNLEVAVGILETFGCAADTATNGLEALERYEAEDYGLIFMDCQMPEMDGFEATAEIRKREMQSGRRIPIVALTASAIEGDRERCLAAGMDDYLSKPFTAEQMKTALVTWLGPSTRSSKRDHLTLVASAAPPPAAAAEPAPPAEPVDAEPIDESVLNALAQLQREGRPDIVNRVITLFLESAPALLKDLEQGVASGDTALLHRASHTLKSASANVGAALLSSRCRELETIARTGPVPDAAARVETIVGDYQRAKAALTARLPRVA
jgi:CheY-like chemotaxis protein